MRDRRWWCERIVHHPEELHWVPEKYKDVYMCEEAVYKCPKMILYVPVDMINQKMADVVNTRAPSLKEFLPVKKSKKGKSDTQTDA